MTGDDFEEVRDSKQSRRSFLRTLGVFLGAGIGVTLMPGNAFAQSGRCCKSTCRSCPLGEVPYSCSGCGNDCCKCLPDFGTCFNSACPCG